MKMNRPKISVLVPVYNVEKYLAECLDSIVGQTLGDIEIICVNDGSTDSSPEILKKYAERDGRIRIIESENKGFCHAHRIALREAIGEYILMGDSDDKYTYEDAFKDIYATAEKYRTDLVLMDYFKMSYCQTRVIATHPVEYPAPDKEVFTARDYENPFITPAPLWTKLFKKAFLDKYDDWYFPEGNITSGDMPLHFQAMIRASSIHHLKKTVYTYRENRPNSLQSTALTETKIRQFCGHFNVMAKTVREEYDFEPHKHLIIRYFFNSLNWRLEKYYRRNIRLMDPETALKIKDAAGDAWATKGERDESEYLKSEEDRKSLVLVKACLRLPPRNLMKYLDMKYHKNLVAVKDESIALRDRIIREQNGFVTYRDGIIKEQDRIIKEKDEHIRNLDELAKSHESQMKRQDEHIRELRRIIGDRDAKIRDQERIIGDRDAKIRAMRSETDAILKSWSYRTGRMITSPLSAPLEAFRSIRDSILVKKSGLFDAEWYLEQNKDVAEAKADPVRHYLKFGWREGRNPSPDFDTKKYLEERPDVSAAGICPLVHYIKFGREK